ncbi:glycosyltransferase family 39 protein [Candidatus Roizmanbacteria bacterium]|nr:glycosyltransferase family 39 protein [Candidatus Roizmanbacteria bacterium]
MGPSPPLSDVLPTLSYILFFEKLKLFSFDAAYNLYSVVLGSVGIGILYFMMKEIFNWRIALFSSLILGFLPRYFGHLHNNMKDIPQAVFFMASLWMFYRLFKKPNITSLTIASISFAVAFNSKVNAVFILIIAFIFLILITINVILSASEGSHNLFVHIRARFFGLRPQNDKRIIIILSYFLIAPIAAFLLWLPFWDNPIGKLLEARHSYTTSTTNMPILYFGNIFYSGNNIPWHYPIGLLSVTTPSLVLFFFLIGLFGLIFDKKIAFEAKLFVLLWFLVPLARYLKPQMIVIDDIRHFMEVIFPFAAIAGIGVYKIYLIVSRISENIFPKINKLFISACYLLFVICYLLFQIISYHPYQTSYYNELIGGIKGASSKFDIEFWASSYKQALKYLNNNASYEAKIAIPMAPDIAKLYLRKDLTKNLNQLNMAGVESKLYSQSDYTVVLNRESFFSWYGIYPYIQNRQPVYSLKLFDTPLVSIYKN